MEKFTKTNAEKYIRTTNDAQVAQLGHLNALMDNIQTSPTSLLVKEGSIPISQIVTMVSQGFPFIGGVTHLALPKEPGKYFLVDSVVFKINSTNFSNQLSLFVGNIDLFNDARYFGFVTSDNGSDDLRNGIFLVPTTYSNKLDSYSPPFSSQDVCIYTTSNVNPYIPLNTPIQYKIFYQSISF